MILLLGIDSPERCLIDMPSYKTIHHSHRSQHTMILVVVLVHPVSPHQKQVLKPIGKLPQLIESVLRAEVSRIGLRHPHHMCIRHILSIYNPDLRYLRNRKLLQLFIGHLPQIVRVIAEVL